MPRMRRIEIGFGFGLALALLLTVPKALAQAPQPPAAGGLAGPGGGMGGMPAAAGGNSLIMILMAPAVQQELKLSDDQKNKIFELAREAARKSREFYQSMIQSGGGNPQALLMAGSRLRQENEKAAAQILSADQQKRAEQIHRRVEGPLAVSRPEIAQELGLKREQIQMVQVTMMQMMQAQRQLLQQGGGANFNPDAAAGPGQGRSGNMRIRDAAVQQISKILDAKQKFAFNKSLGEPFDISKIDPQLASSTTSSSSSDDAAPAPAPAKTAKAGASRKKGAAAKKAATKDGNDDPKPNP
jgi:hypothetical protein